MVIPCTSHDRPSSPTCLQGEGPEGQALARLGMGPSYGVLFSEISVILHEYGIKGIPLKNPLFFKNPPLVVPGFRTRGGLKKRWRKF